MIGHCVNYDSPFILLSDDDNKKNSSDRNFRLFKMCPNFF